MILQPDWRRLRKNRSNILCRETILFSLSILWLEMAVKVTLQLVKMNSGNVVKLSAPVSILMPVCNEVDVIAYVIQEWVDEVCRFLPEGSEFILEDGNSSDGTTAIIRKFAEKYPYIRLIVNPARDGFSAAARRLYQQAKCPLIFFTDSDGQYVARDFWKLAHHIDSYDLIHGSKTGRKDPAFRRYASAVFNKLSWFIFGIPYLDINSAFRLMKAEVIHRTLPETNCMPTLLNAELILRAELENFDIKQVYVLHRFRRFGVSRGLPSYRFAWDSFLALRGLFKIRESYRVGSESKSDSLQS
jgi:glycosyltransferase involved in cell wall biosynthesis